MSKIGNFMYGICLDHKNGLTNKEISEKLGIVTSKEVDDILTEWYDIMEEEGCL